MSSKVARRRSRIRFFAQDCSPNLDQELRSRFVHFAHMGNLLRRNVRTSVGVAREPTMLVLLGWKSSAGEFQVWPCAASTEFK